MGSASELEVNDLWFSLSVDSDILAGSKQSKPLTGDAGLVLHSWSVSLLLRPAWYNCCSNVVLPSAV